MAIGRTCFAVLLLATAPLCAADSINIYFQPTSQFAIAEANVEVWASGLSGATVSGVPLQALGGFEVRVSYDVTYLSFAGIKLGTRLGDPDPAMLEALSDITSDASSGSLDFAEISLLSPIELIGRQSGGTPPTLMDSFLLATLQFEIVQDGTSLVSMSFAAATDPFGLPVPVNAGTSAQIQAEVPEPASSVLLIVALLLLNGFAQAARTRGLGNRVTRR